MIQNKIEKLIPILSQTIVNDEPSLIVSHKNLIFVLKFLKHHLNFKYNLLTCISGVDLLKSDYRFSVVYELLSLKFNSRLKVKVFVNETSYVPSCVSIFVNANWWEREVWDMYGIYFQNHPDLRRILTDYGFEGYPLRKDFPLSGFTEVRYNSNKKRVVHEPLELSQEFRLFNYEVSW